MKKAAWIAAIALTVAAMAALAQESAQETSKPKPSAARAATHPAQTREAESATETTGVMHVPPEPAIRATQTPREAEPTSETAGRMHVPAEPATLPVATEAAAVPTESATLPAGTTVRMKLETVLSTSTAKRNDEFAGRVTEAVMLGGRTIIPVGASVSGHVMQSEEPRRIQGAPVLDLRPESVTMPNGDRFAMNASVVDTSDPKHLHVDEEGRIKGDGHDKTDLLDAGIGVSAGLGIGAYVNGPKGALIGATIGGGAAFVRWMTRRHTETIPAGTELFMELSRPMTMSMSGAAGR